MTAITVFGYKGDRKKIKCIIMQEIGGIMNDNFMVESTAQAFIADTTVCVLGDGGFAKEVKQLLQDIGVKNIRLIGKDQPFPRDSCVIIGVGNPTLKETLSNYYLTNYLNVIHPSVDVKGVLLGEGNVICKGCSLTVDIVIGSHNAINLNCTIGHDVNMGNFNQINPLTSISGGVTIGNKCLIGTGVQILENISICDNVTIGAGTLVTKNIIEAGTYIQSRELKKII